PPRGEEPLGMARAEHRGALPRDQRPCQEWWPNLIQSLGARDIRQVCQLGVESRLGASYPSPAPSTICRQVQSVDRRRCPLPTVAPMSLGESGQMIQDASRKEMNAPIEREKLMEGLGSIQSYEDGGEKAIAVSRRTFLASGVLAGGGLILS